MSQTVEGRDPRRGSRAPLIWAIAMALVVAPLPGAATLRDPGYWVTLGVALAAAVSLGRPPASARPVAESGRSLWWIWRFRTSMFSAGFVIAMGVASPSGWQLVVAAALLCCYLLSMEVATSGPLMARRATNPWFAATGVLLSAGVTALASLPSLNVGWPRMVAGLTALLVVGLLVAPLRHTSPEERER